MESPTFEFGGHFTSDLMNLFRWHANFDAFGLENQPNPKYKSDGLYTFCCFLPLWCSICYCPFKLVKQVLPVSTEKLPNRYAIGEKNAILNREQEHLDKDSLKYQ